MAALLEDERDELKEGGPCPLGRRTGPVGYP